jgi:hypothetical protein
MDEDREFLLWRDRLGTLLTEWKRAQESDEVLLRGPLRIEAQKWLDHRSQDLSEEERKFISASRTLKERLAREERARQLRNAAAIVFTLLAAIPAYIALSDDGLALPGSGSVRSLLDHFSVSFFRPVHSKAEIQRAAALARGSLIEKLHHEDWSIHWAQPNSTKATVPKLEIWASSQAVCAAFRAIAPNDGRLPDFLAVLEASFAQEQLMESNGKRFGWIGGNSDCPQAEPALWTLAAVAVALGRNNLLDKDERQRFLSRLRYTEEVADLYLPTNDGGWNIFPEQENPGEHSTYTTALALLALLEMREGDLDWEGDRSRIDSLIRRTADWSSGQFDVR